MARRRHRALVERSPVPVRAATAQAMVETASVRGNQGRFRQGANAATRQRVKRNRYAGSDSMKEFIRTSDRPVASALPGFGRGIREGWSAAIGRVIGVVRFH